MEWKGLWYVWNVPPPPPPPPHPTLPPNSCGQRRWKEKQRPIEWRPTLMTACLCYLRPTHFVMGLQWCRLQNASFCTNLERKKRNPETKYIRGVICWAKQNSGRIIQAQPWRHPRGPRGQISIHTHILQVFSDNRFVASGKCTGSGPRVRRYWYLTLVRISQSLDSGWLSRFSVPRKPYSPLWCAIHPTGSRIWKITTEGN